MVKTNQPFHQLDRALLGLIGFLNRLKTAEHDYVGVEPLGQATSQEKQEPTMSWSPREGARIQLCGKIEPSV